MIGRWLMVDGGWRNDGRMNRWGDADGWMMKDGWTDDDGWMGACIDGWTHRWMMDGWWIMDGR